MPDPRMLRAHVQLDDGWYTLADPLLLITARQPDQVTACIDQAEAFAQDGGHAIGFVAYEAASAFDPKLTTHRADGPLAAFVLGRQLERIMPGATRAPAFEWHTDWDPTRHTHAVEYVRDWIASGDTYQVNLTFRFRAAAVPRPAEALESFCWCNAGGYGVFIETPDWIIASASPELFFEQRGDSIRCKPMKGTSARGRWSEEDETHRHSLRNSAKDRAENLMIVDMVRNDLGSVCQTGSVATPSLFDVERYPTVWQMTSTVIGTSDARLTDLFRALFPSASVTGAPKRRTMELIRSIEDSPRGPYTGAAGWIGPGRRSRFNVSIRTIAFDRAAGKAVYGTGSGIVWDSDAASEYAECLAKTSILAAIPSGFDLFETFGWTVASGFVRLDEHLQRLAASARYFNLPLDLSRVQSELAAAARSWTEPRRVRLTLLKDGAFKIEPSPFPTTPLNEVIGLAQTPVHSRDIRLFHKTTDRSVYDRSAEMRPGWSDIVLCNERGELTETTRANVAVKREGQWWTPPLSSGLLPGVYRAQLLRDGEITERVIHRSELIPGETIMVFNSLRGRWAATLDG